MSRSATARAGGRSGSARHEPRSRPRPASRPLLKVVSGGLDRLPAGDAAGPIARGRTLILIAALLAAGLVYVNVGALESGDGFGRYSMRVTELQRQNTQLRARIAQLGSTERIQKRASALGLQMPAPEQFTFVRADRGDPLRALRTYTAPATTAPAAAPPAATAPAAAPPVTQSTGAGAQAIGTNPPPGGD